MRVPESGMPEERVWREFFNPRQILDALGLTAVLHDVVDIGCGYGTFAVPAAQRIRGTLYGFDIDPQMVAATQLAVDAARLNNVRLAQRDCVADGTGLASNSIDYAMLFNIFHAERPIALLKDIYRILTPGGTVAIIHWNHDPETPRGPPLALRPTPEDVCVNLNEAGFQIKRSHVPLPPYHFGVLGRKERDHQ